MTFATFITAFISIAYILLIVSTVLLILTENSNLSKTIAWIVVLIFLPALGMVLYYFFGYNPRRIGKSENNFKQFLSELTKNNQVKQQLTTIDYKEKISSPYNRLAGLLEKNNGSKPFYGSNVEIITSGQRKFNALIEDMENARHHIHIEYFYFRKDVTGKKIREILMRKASEGVKVRFIYENVANIDINPKFYYSMRKSGVEVLAFSKASLSWIRRNLNYRDHRKIAIIDGKIGYTGGMNIGDDYSKKWRDTHLRILGEGVYGLQLNFLHAWYESGGNLPTDTGLYFPQAQIYSGNIIQIAPEAPDSRWPYFQLAVISAIQNAEHYIYIQTPYFMPTEPLAQALKSAALSGVDVRLMVSHKSDIFFMDPVTQSYYEDSLRAGIRIYELTDIFSHAKSMVIDDYLSIIGSSNIDSRSLDLCFEINAFIYDPDIAGRNRNIFFDDIMQCKEIVLPEWLKRPWWKKLIQSVMKLFSPLL